MCSEWLLARQSSFLHCQLFRVVPLDRNILAVSISLGPTSTLFGTVWLVVKVLYRPPKLSSLSSSLSTEMLHYQVIAGVDSSFLTWILMGSHPPSQWCISLAITSPLGSPLLWSPSPPPCFDLPSRPILSKLAPSLSPLLCLSSLP